MKKGELLGKALVLATNAHAGQFDRGGNPYLMHPLSVMNILNSQDEELNCIALMHDVIEDSTVTYQDMRDVGMTDRIIEGVKALTKLPGQTYEEYKEGVFANKDAMLVKAADLTHNSDIRRLKGVSQKDIERMVKYHTFFLQIKQRLET